MKRLMCSVLLVATMAGTAGAYSQSGTINVSAEVVAGATSCQLATHDIAFGQYTQDQAQKDTTSTIDVYCDQGILYTVDAGTGQNYLAPDRFMKHTTRGDLLRYTLTYNGQPFGAVSGGVPITGTGVDAFVQYTINASIPGQQEPYVGNYSDVVRVTLSW